MATDVEKFWVWMRECPSKFKCLQDNYGYKFIEFYVDEEEEDNNG